MMLKIRPPLIFSDGIINLLSFTEGHFEREKTRELLQEMKTFVEEFYCNFKASYAQLRRKHRAQLKSFKAQRPNGKLVSNNWFDAKRGFFNELNV